MAPHVSFARKYSQLLQSDPLIPQMEVTKRPWKDHVWVQTRSLFEEAGISRATSTNSTTNALPKTNSITMETPPFENVYPISNGDFPACNVNLLETIQSSNHQFSGANLLLVSGRVRTVTLPETNISPENRLLEKEIPIGNHHF